MLHKNFKNIDKVTYGRGSFSQLGSTIEPIRKENKNYFVFVVDQYFKNNWPLVRFLARWILGKKQDDVVEFIRQKVTSELRKMELMR